MEPRRNSVIGARKWIHHGERRRAILGKNEGVCHKKANKASAELTPVKRKNILHPK
jgi:hypothetical protein